MITREQKYNTWDEAFRGLCPQVRQQSVRVAAYTRELYVQACTDSFGKKSSDGSAKIRKKYTDLAYKCGMYHQLGKALAAPEYQILQSSFTEEQKTVYWKYTVEGRALVAYLQEQGAREKGRLGLLNQENITWQMLREACAEHMERWNGMGLPDGKKGDEISPIAQIVGLAKELDRLSAETKSEYPFDEAIAHITEQSGTDWSPELIEVLKHCEQACRQVYEKYILYTMTLQPTIPLVEKRENRPISLSYLPMVCSEDGKTVCFEAIPRFGGLIYPPDQTETSAEVAPLLKRTELWADVCNYLMYEATDTVLRMVNCRLGAKGVLLQLPSLFFGEENQLERMNEVFENQGVPKDMLFLLLPEEWLLSAEQSAVETVAEYIRGGYQIVLDGYHPENIEPERLKAIGIKYIRFAPELYMSQKTANTMYTMHRAGFGLIGGSADSKESLHWQLSAGAEFVSGTAVGMPASEDALIRDCLLKERGS